MSQNYTSGEAIENIAKGLIQGFHPELLLANFRYIFKETASKKGGKMVFGTVKKMSDQMKYLIDADFLMEIPLDIWNQKDEKFRTALVDHLLERCVGEYNDEDDTTKWRTREPDVHEFSTILQRYGAWTEDLEGFVSAAQSLDLSFMSTSEAEEENEQVGTSGG